LRKGENDFGKASCVLLEDRLPYQFVDFRHGWGQKDRRWGKKKLSDKEIENKPEETGPQA